jgi:cyclic pyranopterin phosphate synthase
MPTLDAMQRPLHDLRISVTDRCNFRCTYCMPKEVFGRDYPFIPREQLLTFEEITRLARLFTALGVEKVRLTGGEPLIRSDVTRLVAMLAGVEGLTDLTMTTNGSLLTRSLAESLRDAGLRRITISVDAIDDAVFRQLNDVEFGVARVLDAIDHAAAAGLTPVKVDVVIRRGVNDSQIVPIARQFRGTGHIVRFIEFMDVGTTNGWKLDDVVPGAEVLRTIAAEWPLEPVEKNYFGEVAERWRYVDGAGEIGVITSVSQPFCGSCTRARLSADGQLYTCLFASQGADLRSLLRSGASDAAIIDAISRVWRVRDDRYSEIRSEETRANERVEMSRIGG